MAKPTVLICDDEPAVREALARAAERAGLACLIDDSGKNTHRLVRKLHPDVVVLDLHQPKDGRDVLAQLKRDPRTRKTPVIILTAEDSQHTRHLCFELGADDYETKPVSPVFMERIARRLREAEGARRRR